MAWASRITAYSARIHRNRSATPVKPLHLSTARKHACQKNERRSDRALESYACSTFSRISAAALVCIYILLLNETGSFSLPVVVMLAIPLTVVGIMPGFWLLNVIAGGSAGGYADPIFFTATGMIGMIALAGIVTRDSIILVDFIHLSLRRGRGLYDAIMESRVVRLRPILLTTLTAMASAAPIALDPIFSGLAWALIFGLFASTIFTLFVIPVAYFLLYGRRAGHGVVQCQEES